MKLQQLMPTLIDDTCEGIKQSLLTFVENEDLCNQESLSTEVVSRFTQGLQNALLGGGKSALKQFIESFDCKEDAIISGPEAKRYTYKISSPKTFLTVFGEMEVNRRQYYHWKGGTAQVPLDEAWGMQGRYCTPEVTETILVSTSMLPAGDVSELLAKSTPFKPSTSLVQDIINQDGAALNTMLQQAEWAEEARPVELPEEPVKALVASMDGANVMVRQPGNKRGRPAEQPGRMTNYKEAQNNGPHNSCSYKNAMVGTISYYGEGKEVIDIRTGEPFLTPNRLQSQYLGQMPEPKSPTFKAEFEQYIQRMEEHLSEEVVRILLMDGARNLWNYVEQNPLYDDYLKVVDFFHASEHLSELSEALFGKSSEKGLAWYERWSRKIKEEDGAVSAMIRSAKRYQAKAKLSKVREKEASTQLTFFERNKGKMHYSELRRQGLPIGSGPVESACKMIVKARFCQSGMRWSIPGGQNVMNLRVVQKSSQWDSMWKTYKTAGGYHRFSGSPHSKTEPVPA